MTGTAATKRTWADGRFGSVLLVVLVTLVFLPSLGGSFVWDDRRFITENPSVLHPESWMRLLTDANTVDTIGGGRGILRPLRTMEFALDHALFGETPAAFRVHSLLWHLVGSVLLLFVLRRLAGDAKVAFAGALLWAVHPLQLESVAFVSSRGDVAMGACAIAAVLLALRSEGFDRYLAWSLVFAALAPLYKEAGFVLFLVLIVLRLTRLSRAPVWPHLLVAAAYLVYWSCLHSGGASHGAGFVLGGSTAGTFATMIRAFGFYLVQFLLPAQAVDWYLAPSTTFADASVLVWLAVHVALVASAVVLRNRRPLWTLAVAWFYVFLLPVSNWPVFLGIATADRFLYLPLAGAGVGVAAVLVRTPRAALGAAFVAAVALGTTTFARSRMWHDEAALWDAVRLDHESPRVHDRLAKILRAEAMELRGEAFSLAPGPERTERLARVKVLLEDSLDRAHRAIDLLCAFELTERSRNPLVRPTELIASNVCYVLGRDAEALFHAEEAVRIDEALDPYAHYDRAMPLLTLGFPPQAMAAMRRARELGFGKSDDEIGTFFFNAATACEQAGLLATAQAGFETAVQAAPDGPLRRTAEERLAALRRRPRPADAASVEEAQLRQLDEALARTPRVCPARRDHAVAR